MTSSPTTDIRELIETIRDSLVWEKPLVSIKEASNDEGVAMLPFAQSTLERMCRQGEIPAKKVKGKWMLSPQRIALWFEQLPGNGAEVELTVSGKADAIINRMRRRA